jgi:hypothetical protein
MAPLGDVLFRLKLLSAFMDSPYQIRINIEPLSSIANYVINIVFMRAIVIFLRTVSSRIFAL